MFGNFMAIYSSSDTHLKRDMKNTADMKVMKSIGNHSIMNAQTQIVSCIGNNAPTWRSNPTGVTLRSTPAI